MFSVQRNGKGFKTAATAMLAVGAVLVLAAAGFASEGGEGAHHVDTAKQMKDFMWRVIDFSVLFAIVVFAIKKAKMKESLADRRTGIEKALQEAQQAREAAEGKLAEYRGKLEKANQEIEEIKAAIRREGEAEKERIIAEAGAMATKIKEQAEMAARQEILKAKTELREEAVRLAVQLAEQTLREQVKKDDQDRLVGEYLTKVVELH